MNSYPRRATALEKTRKLAALVITLALAGCVTPGLSTPVNLPAASTSQTRTPGLPNIDGDVIALSFSGGGARAAAFSLGVLQGLREMPSTGGGSLVDRVALISAVSGGSITAAYFGQRGAEGLDAFRAAYLDKDWHAELHTSMASPANWARAYDGALNERDRLADWLNAEIFHDGTVGELQRSGGPAIWINATDLHSGIPFAFVPEYFDALCSDLGPVRIADAVAASMSVPVVFRPVVVAAYAEHCAAPLPDWVRRAVGDKRASEIMRSIARAFESYRDQKRVRFVHLVDGGVADNFGLSNLAVVRRTATTGFAPFTERDAVRVRRMTFLVVNAEQSRSEEWSLTQEGPSGTETIAAALDAAVNVNKRRGYDAFRDMIAAWEQDIRRYRCSLPKAMAARLSAGIKRWDCRDVHFTVDMISFADLDAAQSARLSAMPTRVSLPADSIDALIDGGKQAVKASPAARELTGGR